MCGIAGIFLVKVADDSTIQQHYACLQAILSQQVHRGPDYQATEIIQTNKSSLFLGHNRLSVIDLSETSHQPMWDQSKRYCLSYNGMLYNYLELRTRLQNLGYTFFSSGDTEVVLKAFMAWGIEAFGYFNGMFALAIFDRIEEKLFLVRDRFGIKPLFYHVKNSQLSFASSSAELARQFALQPNMRVLARGLQYWCYDLAPETVYQDLSMVAPGEVLTFYFSAGLQRKSHHYYALSEQVTSRLLHDANKPAELFEQVEETLTDAIKVRLRSDVNIAISLSGGIDSGTIAGIAKLHCDNLSAYSFGSIQDKYTEAKTVALTAEKINLPVNYIYPSSEEMRIGFFDALTLQDAPFPNLSIVAQYFVFKLAHEQGVKVMLGGQGGDEIFMGYRKYSLFYLQKLLYQRRYITAAYFLARTLPNFMPAVKNIKNNLLNYKRYTQVKLPIHWQRYSDSLNLGANLSEPLWQRQYQDIYALSLPTLLRYEDRNSMGHSIESRLPFLDYRLVELALALPERLKLYGGFNKGILRHISATYLPRQIAFARTKRGFDVNNPFWIRGGLGKSWRDCLNANPALLRTQGLLNQVETYFNDERLCSDPLILSECITLVWLAQKQHFIWS